MNQLLPATPEPPADVRSLVLHLAQELKRISEAPAPILNPITLEEACDLAYKDALRTLRSPRAYKCHIPHLLDFFGSCKLLSDITYEDIEMYQCAALEHWTQNTVRHHVAFLSRVFKCAKRARRIDQSPLGNVRKVPKGESRRLWLTEEAVKRIMDALTPDDRFSFLFFLYTGCRRAEGFRVRVVDCDLLRLELRIGAGKNGRPRFIPIRPELAMAIAEHFKTREDQNGWLLPHYSIVRRYGVKPAALTDLQKRDAVAGCFYQRYKRVLKSVGLGEYHLHDVRRTCATWLLREGADLSVVRDWLGHCSVVVTETYARVDNGNMRRAAARVAWVGPKLVSVDGSPVTFEAPPLPPIPPPRERPITKRRFGYRCAVRPLTDMQRAFAEAFRQNGGNATQAAISAGVVDRRTAAVTGARWLKKDQVQAAILGGAQ